MEGHIWKFACLLVVLLAMKSDSGAMAAVKGNNESRKILEFSDTEVRGDSSLTVKETTSERPTSDNACFASYVHIIDLAAEVNDIGTSIKNMNTQCIKKESNEPLSAKLEELTIKIQGLNAKANEEHESSSENFAAISRILRSLTNIANEEYEFSHEKLIDLARKVQGLTDIINEEKEASAKWSQNISLKIQGITNTANEGKETSCEKYAELPKQMQDITSRLIQLESGLSTLTTQASRIETGLEAVLVKLKGIAAEKNATHEDLANHNSDSVIDKLSNIEDTLNSVKDDLARHVEYTHQCKDGWVKFEGYCYYFSTERHTWQSARDHCRYQRSDLIKITSDSEFNFIAHHIKENSWTGLNDIEVDGIYRWSVDNTIAVNITSKRSWWHGGQPDELRSENCIHYWFLDHLILWNDIPCLTSFRFVCEKKLE